MAKDYTREQLRQLAIREARAAGIDPAIFLRQLGAEAAWQTGARSHAGAQGVAQIMPFHDVRPDLPGHQRAGVRPDWDIRWAARHNASNLKKYGNYRDMLSVYNSGRPWSRGRGISETRNYVGKILGGSNPKPGVSNAALTAAAPRQATAQSSSQPLVQESMRSMMAAQMLAQASQTAGGGSQLGNPEGLMAMAMARQQASVQQAPGPAEAPGRPPIKLKIQGKVDETAVGAVAIAKEFLGTPYSWGGGGPGGPSKGIGRGANTVGFDCSSLLQYTWAKQGVKIPRVTYDQWNAGRPVGRKQLQPGDAVFFNKGSRGPEHVGMYVGNGKFIEAPRTGLTVRISKLAGRSDYVGARRFK